MKLVSATAYNTPNNEEYCVTSRNDVINLKCSWVQKYVK